VKRLRAVADVKKRQALLKEIDAKGILATPQNSSINELVVEAGRLSITHSGRAAVIKYGAKPGVRLS
jgi:hypothetical protein